MSIANEILKLEQSSFRDLHRHVNDLKKKKKDSNDTERLRLASAVLERRTFQLTRRLVCRASRALNIDLQPWILRNLKPFTEEDSKEKRRDSGTMEQYKVFMEYEEKLGKYLDEFCEAEGFASVQDCFAIINKAVQKDRVLNAKHMKEIEKVMRNLESEHAEAVMEEENESKYDEDEEPVDVDSILTNIIDGVEDEDKIEEQKKHVRKQNLKRKPQIIVFQPMSCDILIKSLLQITDFEAFSQMMKRKAHHISHMRKVENDIRTIAIKARARRKILNHHVKDEDVLVESFLELKKRVVDLLPSREDMKKDVQSKMDESLFSDVIRDDSTSSYTLSLKSMTRFLFGHISKLCSSSHRRAIEKHKIELLDMIGNEDTKEADDDDDDEDDDERYGNRFARRFLLHAHGDIDRIKIEVNTFMKSAFGRVNAM